MGNSLIEQRLSLGRKFHIPDFIFSHLLALYPPVPADAALDQKHQRLRMGLAVELTLKWLMVANGIEFVNAGELSKIDFSAFGVCYDVKAMGWHMDLATSTWVMSGSITASVPQHKHWEELMYRQKKPVHVFVAAYTDQTHTKFVILGIIDWAKAITYPKRAKTRYEEPRVALGIETALKLNLADDPMFELFEHDLKVPILM